MSLGSLISHIREVGLPTSAHYLVEFNKGEDQSVQMLVDQVNMPGINIMTTEMRTFGEVTETPYGINYGPVTISVIVDNDGNALRFFHDWANQVYDRNTRFLGWRSGMNGYASDVTISILNKNDDTITKLTLEGAYPKIIGDLQLDATNHDVMRLSVTFIYNRWTRDDVPASSIDGKPAIDIQLNNPYAPDNLIPSVLTFDNPVAGVVSNIDNQIGLRDWGTVDAIPDQLTTFGGDMSSSLGRSIGQCTRAMSDKAGVPIPLVGADGSDHHNDFKSSLNNLTSNFVNFGEGLRDLGRGLSAVTAPAQAIAGSISSVSGTLGAMDSTLNALGLGTPFSKVRQNLNATAGKLSTVARLKDIPSHLGTIGANMGAIGGTFKNVSNSIDKATNAPAQMKSALNKLGFNFERQGQNLTNGAGNLDNYANQ